MSGTHQPIDGYLDDLFDRLGGQGGAGRRMLEEAADHLRSSAAEMVRSGVPEAEAERRAIAAFGAAGPIAALLDEVHGGTRLAAAAATAASIAGRGVLMLAGAHLAAAVVLSVWGTSVPIMRQTATTGAVQLLIAIIVLGGRLGAVKAGWLPSAVSAHTNLGAALAALLGVAVLVDLPLAAAQMWNMTGLWRLAAALTTLFALINLFVVAVAHRLAGPDPATQATAQTLTPD